MKRLDTKIRWFRKKVRKISRGLSFSRNSRLSRRAVHEVQLQGRTVTRKGGSSVSDCSSYTSVLAAATENPKCFAVFRSHPEFMAVLDHVSVSQGKQYAEILAERGANLQAQVQRFSPFSSVGSPQTFRFGRLGRAAPTLFRYLKVASDLQILFPKLSEMTITEVGVGWGGQTWLLAALNPGQRISMYDLPEAVSLATKMFTALGLDAKSITPVDALSEFEVVKGHLFLSNYAFSELNRANQDKYLNQLISASTAGYITWNALSDDGYSADDLVKMIPGAEIMEERPLTSSQNVIVVWGHSARI